MNLGVAQADFLWYYVKVEKTSRNCRFSPTLVGVWQIRRLQWLFIVRLLLRQVYYVNLLFYCMTDPTCRSNYYGGGNYR